MAKLSNVEIAYQFLQNKPNGEDFNTVWNEIASHLHADNNDDKSKLIADLYADMVLDNRFALTIDNKWALRSNLHLEDVKKNYDFVDSFDFDSDFDDIDNEDVQSHNNEDNDDETIEVDEDEDDTTSFVPSGEDSYDDEDN